jgi:hypothetical protein
VNRCSELSDETRLKCDRLKANRYNEVNGNNDTDRGFE